MEFDTRALLWLGLIGIVLWFFRIKFFHYPNPAIRYSIADQIDPEGDSKVHFSKLPSRILFLSLLFFSIGFLDLAYRQEWKEQIDLPPKNEESDEQITIPTEGVAVYLVLDRSGSMREPVVVSNQQGVRRITRLDYLKEVSAAFIEGDASVGLEGRKSDLIGLVAFARTAEILSPLTFDHKALLEKLADMRVAENSLEDGTALGYAVYKTANLIAATRNFAKEKREKEKAAYEIKSSVILLVTDGIPNPHPLDKGNHLRTMTIDEASRFAKEQGIRVYIVNVEPQILKRELAPFKRQLESAAEITGGQFFVADQRNTLPKIYHEIEMLEKSRIPFDRVVKEPSGGSEDSIDVDFERVSLYPYFIAIAIFFFCFGIWLENGPFREVP
jgi:Ca-activated chloride channel family protein